MKTTIFALALLIALAAAATQPVLAQETQGAGALPNITYQGRLDDGGTPVTGQVDLVFRFFDAQSGGTEVWSDQFNGVSVDDGYFTQHIPVAPSIFADDLWLEIEVANPAGSGQFDTLTPRQPVTSAPRALVAGSVEPGALFWELAVVRGFQTDIIYEGGWVGINTPAPTAPLHVNGDAGNNEAMIARYPGTTNGGVAIKGESNASSGGVTGVWGHAEESPDGTGVLGIARATSGTTRGVHGIVRSPGGHAVFAQSLATTGTPRALYARNDSSFGYAGYFEGGRNYFEGRVGIGEETAPNYLIDAKGANAAIRAHATGGTPAFLRLEREGNGIGYIALGSNDSMFFNINATDRMVLDSGGRLGLGTQTPQATVDVLIGGSTQTGMRVTNGAGGTGFAANVGFNGIGFHATTSGGVGVSAVANGSGSTAVRGTANHADGTAVEGIATSSSGNNTGVLGTTQSSNGVGVHGETSFGGTGVLGISQAGGIGVHAVAPVTGVALLADGDVQVNGTLSKSAGSFRIDHPLSPKTHFLSHSFVESPDMMNIYNGNVTTDSDGFAEVTLPDWFEALNRDFRYQLTVVGSFAQAMVAEKVSDNRFAIRTSEPNVEVSWQVTGIRDDPYARANPIEVETPKPDDSIGSYQFREYETWSDH